MLRGHAGGGLAVVAGGAGLRQRIEQRMIVGAAEFEALDAVAGDAFCGCHRVAVDRADGGVAVVAA